MLPNNKILDLTRLKHLELTNVALLIISVFDKEETLWERTKCHLPAFSPFPTMSSKAIFFKIVKAWDCVKKG